MQNILFIASRPVPQCYSLIHPQKILSVKILMLTNLLIESEIREREEIPSEDEKE